MIKRYVVIFILVFAYSEVSAQLTDLARLEYTYFPQSNSDNSFRRFRTFLNVPIKVDDDSYLVPGFEYRNVELQFEDLVDFDKGDLNRYQSFKLSLGYTFKMKNDWRFGSQIGARVASNFSDGDVVFNNNDLIYTGGIYFIKDKTDEGAKRPWRIVIGAQYNTATGRPFPLPFVNYYNEFKPGWSYTLGVPKMNIKRVFGATERHSVQSFITLDGFFANIQGNRVIADPDDGAAPTIANNISMTIVLSGLGYEYKIMDHLYFYAYAGFTVVNDIRLRNDDNDDVFTLNDTNSFYGRSGIKFKI